MTITGRYLFGLALLGLACAARVLQITDLHYDPLYEASAKPDSFCRVDGKSHDVFNSSLTSNAVSLGQYGCDAPESLIRSAVAAAAAVEPHPDVILLSGDLGPHKSPDESTTLKAISTVATIVRSQFPAATIIPTLGNDDLFPNYGMAAGPSDQLTSITRALSPVLDSSQTSQFARCGFLNATAAGLHIISLNTILYSRQYVPEDMVFGLAGSGSSDDPCGQFAWLERTLTYVQTRGESALLVLHIPPGYHISPESKDIDSRLWHDSYVERFGSIVSSHSGGAVAGMVAGHLHTDVFRLLGADAGNPDGAGLFVLSAPSVSPVDGNNPSFRVYDVAGVTGSPMDWTQYYLPLADAAPSWRREYTFSQRYSAVLERPDVHGLTALASEFAGSATLFASYVESAFVGTVQSVSKDARKAMICAAEHVLHDNYKSCLKKIDVSKN